MTSQIKVEIPDVKRILTILKEFDYLDFGLHTREIVKKLNINENTLRMHLSYLIESGFIYRPVRGHYKITREGVLILQGRGILNEHNR